MNKITLIFLFVFFFSFSSYGQVSVGENGNIEVKAGATLDVAGLEITPISDYNITAGVTINKSDTSIVLPNGDSMNRSYYLDPAQRRFFPEYMTTNYIGFRCAMSYLGESRNVTKPKKR